MRISVPKIVDVQLDLLGVIYRWPLSRHKKLPNISKTLWYSYPSCIIYIRHTLLPQLPKYHILYYTTWTTTCSQCVSLSDEVAIWWITIYLLHAATKGFWSHCDKMQHKCLPRTTTSEPEHLMLSLMRPRRSVWSMPHSAGTFFTHRLWTLISHADNKHGKQFMQPMALTQLPGIEIN